MPRRLPGPAGCAEEESREEGQGEATPGKFFGGANPSAAGELLQLRGGLLSFCKVGRLVTLARV